MVIFAPRPSRNPDIGRAEDDDDAVLGHAAWKAPAAVTESANIARVDFMVELNECNNYRIGQIILGSAEEDLLE